VKFGCCVVVQVGLFREIGIYPLDGHSVWQGSLWVIIQKKKLVEQTGFAWHFSFGFS
jgi:hypothetical protein